MGWGLGLHIIKKVGGALDLIVSVSGLWMQWNQMPLVAVPVTPYPGGLDLGL